MALQSKRSHIDQTPKVRSLILGSYRSLVCVCVHHHVGVLIIMWVCLVLLCRIRVYCVIVVISKTLAFM